jgi:hypothetical protein
MNGKLIGVSPKTDTLTVLPKGAEVHKDWDTLLRKTGTDDYSAILERSAALTTIQQGVYGGDATKQFNINYNAMGQAFGEALNKSIHKMPKGLSKQQTKEAFQEALGNSRFINKLM